MGRDRHISPCLPNFNLVRMWAAFGTIVRRSRGIQRNLMELFRKMGAIRVGFHGAVEGLRRRKPHLGELGCLGPNLAFRADQCCPNSAQMCPNWASCCGCTRSGRIDAQSLEIVKMNTNEAKTSFNRLQVLDGAQSRRRIAPPKVAHKNSVSAAAALSEHTKYQVAVTVGTFPTDWVEFAERSAFASCTNLEGRYREYPH